MSKRSLNKIFNTLIAAGVLTSMFVTTAIPVNAIQNVVDTPTAQSATQSQKRSIGYYADWSMYEGEGETTPENIPADKLTHLNVAFNGLTKDGHLRMLDPDANFGHPLKHAGVTWGDIGGGIVNDLQNVRAKNPNLKLGFSLGGWSLSGIFTHVARNDAARKTMAKEVSELLEYTNFDFIDLDWEYPADKRDPDKVDLKNDEGNPDAIPEDKQNYVLLLKEIRSELNKLSLKTGKKYEISIAIGMSHYKTEIGIDVPKIFEIIDFANVMTYDANGAWSAVSGHQTALYDNPNDPMAGKGFTVDSSIKNFLKLGAPPEKLVVGAAFYTRGWEKVNNNGPDKSLPGLFGTAEKINKDIDLSLGYGAKNDKELKTGDGGRNAGNWAWRNRDLLHTAYPGLVEYWDDTAKAPYLYNKDTGAFFTYDNKRSIGEKTKYVNANNLGGIITWMASNDKRTASGKNDDLTTAIYNGLFGTAKLPTYEVKDPIVNASAVLTPSQNSWEKTGLLNVQFKNDMKLTSNGSAMVKKAEEAVDTLKYVKMYIKTSNGLTITGGESPSPTPTLQNGYYVLDFGSSYDMKLIKSGESKSFNLKLNQMIDSKMKGVEEIYITQRMYKDAPEFGKTILFKNSNVIVYEAEDVNNDEKINQADLDLVASKYNLKTGQTGFDVKCDITKNGVIDLFDIVRVGSKLQAGGTVNPPGPNANEWDANKVYKGGETCVYQGVTYRAQWETKGETPGQPWNAWVKVA